MPKATCALCGAANPISRVFVAFTKASLNMLGLSCTSCGKIGSQLQALGHNVGFAAIYSMVASLLIAIAMAVLPTELDVSVGATIGALLPWMFLPPWWSMRMAATFAEAAPRDDYPRAQKVLGGLAALLVIVCVVGCTVFAYVWFVEHRM